ncbi:hypothetical protein EUBHAL_01892 [Anaerobutyricum hallii DSM 3353]|uniref:Uncharacterized protein n=1 Tax=Anaerobutyricum hallii DSM 3353 TaxID=411469 RepID=C0EWU9_9FIRM|nr:hypothetical protein EUBHAL_01892 [Anaerobutyricum hallii DSM 3353]
MRKEKNFRQSIFQTRSKVHRIKKLCYSSLRYINTSRKKGIQ